MALIPNSSLLDALGGGGVEGAGGLVAEQDLGVRGERPGDDL